MRDNPIFAKGTYKGSNCKRAKYNSLWTELKNLLNASGPPLKEVEEWKMVNF